MMSEQQMQAVAAAKAIPAGYKQTEVGVIPVDWSVTNLSAITDQLRPISYGIVQTGPLIANGIQCIRVVDISCGEIKKNNLITTSSEISNSYRRTILKFGDLVIPLRGKVGEIALIDDDLVGANLTRGVALIALNKGHAPRYIKQYLSSSCSADRLLASMNGSALQEITIDTLRRFNIAIPASVEEQTAIANVLSDTDALISALEQLIAKKQAIKAATMQQLLTGRTRLPAFALRPDGSKKGYKSSELGEIPEDWEVVCIGDLGRFRGGNGFPVIEQGKLSGEYPFYKVSDMNNEGNDVYMSASNNWISKEDQSRLGSFVFPSGCIVFAKVGAAVFLERKKILSMPSCIDNNMAALETNRDKCDVNFIYHFLQSVRFGDFVSTTALPSLSSSILSTMKIVKLLIEEQTAIATILSDMDRELQTLSQKLEKTRALKQGMMQQLLTGKIRLPLASITTQGASDAN